MFIDAELDAILDIGGSVSAKFSKAAESSGGGCQSQHMDILSSASPSICFTGSSNKGFPKPLGFRQFLRCVMQGDVRVRVGKHIFGHHCTQLARTLGQDFDVPKAMFSLRSFLCLVLSLHFSPEAAVSALQTMSDADPLTPLLHATTRPSAGRVRQAIVDIQDELCFLATKGTILPVYGVALLVDIV